MLEAPTLPIQSLEQVILSADLRVAALGHALPRWLGVEPGRCVGVSITQLMLQLEAATHARGLTEDVSAALDRVHGTHLPQTTGLHRVSVASPTELELLLRVVVTPLAAAAAGQAPCIVLGFEDLSAGELFAEQREDLERANAELLREIGEHLKTENTLRVTQEQLHHSQRLEAVGRLAGGIAHDFNNLLSIVLGYSLTLVDALPPDSPLRADVEEIHRAGERAAELTRQLLAFGRQQVLEPRVVDLNEILLRMDRMVRRILGEDISIVTLPCAELWKTKVDPGQIEQVLVNLVINARDAMPKGGTLTMETANHVFDEDYAQSHIGATPGPHVMLAVSDTGTGMDKGTQARAFEPFFTTKDKGKGTGLGLATVFGIVKQSGGHIWLYSESGKGSTFKLCFPRCDAFDTSMLEPRRLSSSPPPRGRETVLLVEDDVQLRAMARTILLRQGYRVLDAPDGLEALKLSGELDAEIALLVTDVVMPHMHGRELARRLVQQRPRLRVLYMSGYTDNAIVHNGVLDEGVHFLQKPITPETLARKVRQVLDRR